MLDLSRPTHNARMYLSRALNRSLAPPDWVSVNVTLRCNLKCIMCTTCYDEADELSLEEILGIIDQTAAWGVKVFNPLGGEPFVRADLEDILDHACSKDFFVTVTTNGTLIHPRRAERIARIPPSKLHFNISLDGPEDVHDVIRGPQQFQRALAGYRAVREADARAGNSRRKITANTIIHRRNIERLPAFLDELAALGFDGVQLLNLFRHGKGQPEDEAGLWFWPEHLPTLERGVEELVRRVRTQGRSGFRIQNTENDLRLVPSYYRDELKPLEAKCWSGWKELYINSDGNAIMCDGSLEFLQGRFGNVREQTLQQIWESSELAGRRRVVKGCTTPCIQNCYLRRDSDSMLEIVKGAATLALEEFKERVARRRARHGEVEDLELPEATLTLELSDTAPWPKGPAGPWRSFQQLVSTSPVPIDRCYEDPFEYYEYRNRRYLVFDRGFMGFEVVRSVIDDLRASRMRVGTLALSWRGEPLMHPEVVPLLQWLLETSASAPVFDELRVVTDGRLLNTQIADLASMHRAVRQTWVLHGNGVGPWEDQVLRNFDYLLHVRQPHQRVVASWEVDEALDPHRFVDLWQGRLSSPWVVAGRLPPAGDGIWFRRTDHDNFQANREARERLIEVAGVLGLPVDPGDESKPRRCPGPWSTPVVSWDGKVTLCPWDRELRNVVGEVAHGDPTRRLAVLWRQDGHLAALRREARGKGVPGLDLCRDCHYVYSPNYRMASAEELTRL